MNLTEFSNFFNQTAAFAQAGVPFVYVVAVVLATWFVFSGLLWVIQKGNPRSQGADRTWGVILMRFFWATCLATLARVRAEFETANGSVEGARSALAYFQTQGASNAQFQAIYTALAIWCVFIGTIGFCRGFVLFDKASQGGHDSGDTFWRGLWHVIFGALTVQIFS